MFITIFISFISLIILVSLHELGHFLTARKFGVRVEEFGFGYPPRIFGKKIGETVYSLNLLPFGAFVRISEQDRTDPSSFSAKPLWQRALIIFNGAAFFWLVAAVLFSIVFMIGAPTAIGDSETGVPETKVQITSVSAGSPASQAGLKAGDIILGLKSESAEITVNKVKEVQEFIDAARGKNIVLSLKRGGKVFEAEAIPRESPPSGQGALGIGLARTGLKSYPVFSSVFEGIKATFRVTELVIVTYAKSLGQVFRRLPTGLQLVGPIGIVGLLSQGVSMGASYFLQMIGFLSINVAVINLLPIPAFDGGKLFFLGIEAIRKKPVSQKLEEKITFVFFSLLIILMVFVSIKDIRNIF
ncbi:MAG: M50 family metallopeptidase [bacterium]|nr:M50 family metallopeptidase [bacterium]